MVSMREQIKRECADSEVKRRAARKIGPIKQASAESRARKEKGKAVQDKILKNPGDKYYRVVKDKKNNVTKSGKQARKRQKQPSQKIDLKHCNDLTVDELLNMVAEKKNKNKEAIKNLLDKLWRRSMSGGTLTEKDCRAIKAAMGLLREMDSKTS